MISWQIKHQIHRKIRNFDQNRSNSRTLCLSITWTPLSKMFSPNFLFPSELFGAKTQIKAIKKATNLVSIVSQTIINPFPIVLPFSFDWTQTRTHIAIYIAMHAYSKKPPSFWALDECPQLKGKKITEDFQLFIWKLPKINQKLFFSSNVTKFPTVLQLPCLTTQICLYLFVFVAFSVNGTQKISFSSGPQTEGKNVQKK